EREYPREQTIVTLFEQQVESTPEAIAVECAGKKLTYGDLNARANQLARYLHALGVEVETRVGVYCPRGLESIVAILGILKSGAAYVPIDPGYPEERLHFLVKDSGMKILLSADQQVLTGVPAGLLHVDILKDAERIAGESSIVPAFPCGCRNLACLLYTSGSTGTPKGVEVEHRSVLRLVKEPNFVELSNRDVFLQFAPLSFDASAFEIFGCLLNGGRLVLPPVSPSVEELGEVIEQHGVTVLWLTAGLFHQAVERISDRLVNVKYLVAGGDVLSPEQVFKAADRLPNTRIINGYGPTENTTFTCCHMISPADDRARSISIGRPISNTKVYVLDERLMPMPPGVAGELYTGGDGLARGYLNRPELTAGCFLPNLFGRQPGERLYRTGDLVRWRNEGTLEFLGRRDQQVKVRGFRIELGEIEATLQEHAGVRQAAVIAREDEPGDKRLVAYVVLDAAVSGLRSEELSEHLRGRLPGYMVPSVYVEMEELPLTANGKLDRKRLPRPEGGGVGNRREYVGPGNAEEEIVCGIWEQVLKLERVGVEENFFDLGGHSLLATQVVSRVRETFATELPLRVLFEQPTVAGMARELKLARGRKEPGRGAGKPLVRVPERAELPLSYAQQRLWFLEQMEPGNAVYNIAFALRLKGNLDRAGLRKSLAEIVRRHDALRTVFGLNREQEPVQRVQAAETAEPRVEEIELGHLSAGEREAEVRRLRRVEAAQGFDLHAGPLMRVKLIRLEEQEHVLLVTMHHIVSDGWSLGVLVQEFREIYGAEREQRRVELEELPVQYGDYAVWQREWLQGEVLEEQLGYWKEQLAGVETLELPTDRPRAAAGSHGGATVWLELGEERTGKIRDLSRREGVTLFMTLLGGVQILLGRYTGQQDIAVGTPIANRTRREIEPLIGFFVNTLVVRTQVRPEISVGELLREVRATTLAAYGHQDVPFERLVEELQPVRDMSREPLFQVMLAVQNAPVEELALPELSLEVMEPEPGEAAKFDLTFTVVETAGKLRIGINYATDLYEETSIERMGRHLERVLEGASRDGGTGIAEIEILSPAEREQVVEEWNRTEREYPREQTIVTLFEQQVESTPEAIAVE
ncbi:MAG: amino acid adenylation domain-containing protein, partial [Acidobacteriia bacterium]|nr:amino acid adenylation domain-containing protein [Terriglobia bacterium]